MAWPLATLEIHGVLTEMAFTVECDDKPVDLPDFFHVLKPGILNSRCDDLLNSQA